MPFAMVIWVLLLAEVQLLGSAQPWHIVLNLDHGSNGQYFGRIVISTKGGVVYVSDVIQ